MLILGIETSCDETGVALLEGKPTDGSFRVISELVRSQNKTHEAYGGVVPELAAREHSKNLPLLFHQLLSETNLSLKEIDTIAVTTGPGLKGCLLTGMLFASGLSASRNIPIISVNHIEAHLLSVLLKHPTLTFPFISLIVSGGHTELHFVENIGHYTLLAKTSDDAAGEAFDKSAHLLGIPYPGGAELAKCADAFTGKSEFTLPTVMKHSPGFSFSGLKTAISLLIREHKESIDERRNELAFMIQKSIIEALLLKTKRALSATGCDRLAVAGGVSANHALQKAISSLPGVQSFFPEMHHCMDNASMIALCGYLRQLNELPTTTFNARPRWPIATDTSDVNI